MTAAGMVLVREKEPPSRSAKPSGNARNGGPATSSLPGSTVGPPAALGHLRGCVLCPLKTCHPGCKEGQTDRQRRPSSLGGSTGAWNSLWSALGHPAQLHIPSKHLCPRPPRRAGGCVQGLQLSTFFKSCYFRPECPTEKSACEWEGEWSSHGHGAGRAASGQGGCGSGKLFSHHSKFSRWLRSWAEHSPPCR